MFDYKWLLCVCFFLISKWFATEIKCKINKSLKLDLVLQARKYLTKKPVLLMCYEFVVESLFD